MDPNARQQITDRLKDANNILITVSANPSVDQLAACVGITLVLNHLNKHATAVFSGEIPSTIEFLKPEETIEKNTDSLRDFIIALDKSKADKLRYKVEDKIVKIFITPYRTSITDKDLDFSQGDFNVDAVLALGVHERTELDKAIVAHGRILHDATVISVNNKDQGNLGAINWVDLNASSLSEMLAELTKGLTTEAVDGQVATAFMTGIVAETARFSNTKTTPRTMSLAAELMSAGANQQLIASKLEAAQPVSVAKDTQNKEAAAEVDDGTGLLKISHKDKEAEDNSAGEGDTPQDLPLDPVDDKPQDKPVVDEDQKTDDKPELLGAMPSSMVSPPIMTHSSSIGTSTNRTIPSTPAESPSLSSNMTMEPPSLGGQLTANSQPEHLQVEPSTDPLTLPSVDISASTPPPLLTRPASLSGTTIQPGGPVDVTNTDLKTLSGIEQSASSPPLNNDVPAPMPNESEEKEEVLDDAREAVDEAIASVPSTQPLGPIAGLGAQPVNLNLGNAPAPMPATPQFNDPAPVLPLGSAPQPPAPFGAPADTNGVNPNVPTNLLPLSQPVDTTASNGNPTAPPPVPPPLPQF